MISYFLGIGSFGVLQMIDDPHFLKAPKFEVGNCLLWTYKNEFETHKHYTKVLRVGKTSYKLGRHENERYPDVQDFETAHNLYEKIDCSQMYK